MGILDETPSSRWQALLDDIAERFDIHTTLSNAENKIVLEAGQHNSVCTKVRARSDSLTSICMQSASTMTHEARATAKPSTDLCELGMFKTVVPIFEGETFLGALSACGKILDEEPLEAFLVAKVLGIEEAEAERFIADVRVIDQDTARAITEAFVSGIDTARGGG